MKKRKSIFTQVKTRFHPGENGFPIKIQEKTLNFKELVESEGRYLSFGKKILEHPNDHLEAFSTSNYAYGLSTRSEKDFQTGHSLWGR